MADGVTLGSLQNHCGVMLAHVGDHFGIILGSFGDHACICIAVANFCLTSEVGGPC